MKAMKTALAVTLFVVISVSTPVFASEPDQPAVAAAEAACGQNDVEFRVTTSSHPDPQLDAGKAIVYVVEVQDLQAWRAQTTRMGMDGAWLGANRGNTYLVFSVDPGEHHFCADWTSSGSGTRLVSLASLTAEPGKVYYLRARTDGGRYTYPSIDLDLVNSDEGRLLVALSASSQSEVKKRGGSK
jgi:hypothetical protein